MSRFAGLGGVKTNQGGLYFMDDPIGTSADFLVKIQDVKMVQARAGHDSFIIAAKVLESTNPKRTKGCVPSHVIAIKSAYFETAMGDIKAFAGAVLQMDDPDGYLAECAPGESQDDANERYWGEALEFMVDEKEQPVRGYVMRLHCTVVAKRDGGPFTKHQWGPVVEIPGAEVGVATEA